MSGVNFNDTTNIPVVLTKTVVINTIDDFPAPSAGVITLVDGTEYVINADVSTSNRFVVPTAAAVTLRCMNSLFTRLTYTGVDDMFTGTGINMLSLRFGAWSCPNGTMFNINGTSPGFVWLHGLQLTDVDTLGTLQNVDLFAHEAILTDFGDGWIFDNMSRIVWETMDTVSGKNRVNAVLFTMQGANGNIEFNDDFFSLQSNETLFDIKAASTTTSAIVGSNSISGTGTIFAAGSKDQSDPSWVYAANGKIENSTVKGAMSLQANATETVIAATDTAVIINAVWTEVSSERMTFSSAGRFTYSGLEDVSMGVSISAVLNNAGGGTDTLSIYMAKNGSVVATSQMQADVTNQSGISIRTEADLVTNDFIEFFVENNSDTSNITVSYATVLLNKI